MDSRRGSDPSITWGFHWSLHQSTRPASFRANSIAYGPTYAQLPYQQPNSSISMPDLSLMLNIGDSPNNEVCPNCSRSLPQIIPAINGSTPLINPGNMADVHPKYTYSVNVLVNRQHEAAPNPGYSMIYDNIEPIASTIEEYEKWHQTAAGHLTSTIIEEDLTESPEKEGTESWTWEEEVETLPWGDNLPATSENGPSRVPSIQNLLNITTEDIDPSQPSLPIDVIMEDQESPSTETLSVDPATQTETSTDDGVVVDKGKQPAATHTEGVTNAVDDLARLGLLEDLPSIEFKPSVPELWDTPKPATAPAPWNGVWISKCFFVGLGRNQFGSFEFTQIVLPRRKGTEGKHEPTAGCDTCGIAIMYARYLAPEVKKHPRVMAQLKYLEYNLAKRHGIRFIDEHPTIDLIICNDLFKITGFYAEDQSNPHWAITHSTNWEEIKDTINQGMTWCQASYPDELRAALNRCVVYANMLKYLLMCKVLMATESVEFGGDRWEMPRSEFLRGSMADEFKYWAGLHMVNFNTQAGFGNIIGFVPEANDGMGDFTDADEYVHY